MRRYYGGCIKSRVVRLPQEGVHTRGRGRSHQARGPLCQTVVTVILELSAFTPEWVRKAQSAVGLPDETNESLVDYGPQFTSPALPDSKPGTCSRSQLISLARTSRPSWVSE